MSPIEMTRAAAQAMATPGSHGVVLTITKGEIPHGFPRGELLNEMERGGVVEHVYLFPPEQVIAWLVKNGLIWMERTADNQLSFYAAPELTKEH